MTRPRRIVLSVLAMIASPIYLLVAGVGLLLVVCFYAVAGVIAEVFEK